MLKIIYEDGTTIVLTSVQSVRVDGMRRIFVQTYGNSEVLHRNVLSFTFEEDFH